ncbi:TonB-dependent receptor [Aquimarina sp. 2201CG14-23]|uniref:TonB-dependent receptor n=1 Tax=Aquimarina mycalae TaxID=3040073 RepID=UPI002478228E|nr:TonB-dependent receptor [Aquimarina sp. 2201CG14-23]MDH7446006.1 TonB-dependent receptor [Aquimarina sp. 2201CG14-23]
MKKLFTAIALFYLGLNFAQETGSIAGTLLDKEVNNQPLPFANIVIVGTSTGTSTDFDGKYEMTNIPIGTYTLEFSFTGYETLRIPNVIVESDKVTVIDTGLGATAAELGEVFIKVQTSKEREQALLLEQRKAVVVKESIGAEQLTKLGVSNAAGATTKISGVSKTEGSGDVYVRGLGDRYLTTTLNGLPVPSDDIERKNIGLDLFSTRLIQNVAISKTFSSNLSSDAASGNIDIVTKDPTAKRTISANVSAGVNTNVIKNDVFDNFKVSPNNDDVTLGYYNGEGASEAALTNQSWSPETVSTPINRNVAITFGKRFGEKIKFLATAGQSTSFEYRDGIFRQFRSNFIDDTIPDAIQWNKKITTSALVNTEYKINEDNKVKFTILHINKITEQVFEGGRAGTATIFEETDQMEIAPDGNVFFQFIRDQNIKKTQLNIAQLHGTHDFSEKNKLDWSIGYNNVIADEPNRIRNEVNFTEDSFVQFGRTGGFQQRKSTQEITDNEFNGKINDLYKIVDTENKTFNISAGVNYRNKTRDFSSQFFGLEEDFTNAVNPISIDALSEAIIVNNGLNPLLDINILEEDSYEGSLQSLAGYVNFTGRIGKLSAEAGVRYQKDNIDVDFDVNNFPGRLGSADKEYNRLYPSLNLKYAVNEKFSVRIANSITTTLPEFKEIAPFEYVSPTGQVTRGNPNLEASLDFNYDLKFEYFPTPDQLFSLTGFHKNIEDPINKVQDRGSAGVFSYFNSGDEANIYGLEVEGRINLLKTGDSLPDLRLNFNVSRMWHTQDLKEIRDDQGNLIRTFRYNNLTEVGLQGASDWIVNASLNFNTKQEFPFEATVSANYASDRVFALGAPEIQSAGDQFYNDAIIEKGFVTLDLILSKKLNDHMKIGLSGKNLINPDIQRTQLVKPSTTGIQTEETVRSYTNGRQISLNFSYNF